MYSKRNWSSKIKVYHNLRYKTILYEVYGTFKIEHKSWLT